MEERYDYYEDEISIGGLLLFCVKHWKSIALAVIIGLVLGAGFKAVTSGSAKSEEEILAEGQEEEADAEEELLSEIEAAENLVKYSEQKMESLNTYFRTTKLMDLDPYALYQGSVSYTVNVPETDLKDAMAKLYAYATEGRLYAELEANTGLYSAKDLEYLVSATGLGKEKIELDDSVIIDLFAENQVFTISVLGQTEAEAEQLLAGAQEAIESYLNGLKRSVDIQSASAEETVIVETTSMELADYQAKLANALSAENDVLTKRITALESLQTEQETVLVEAGNSGISVKKVVMFAAIGAVVGGICMAGVWVLVYLFGGKLYAVADVERKFRTKVLGTVCDTQKVKGLDRWVAQKQGGVYSSLTKEEQQEIVLSNVKNELKKNYEEGCKVFMSSSLGTGMAESVRFLVQGLTAAGYHVEECQSVLGHADALEKLSQCDVAIVIENPAQTRNGLLEKEMDVLKEYVGNVAGMVTVG